MLFIDAPFVPRFLFQIMMKKVVLNLHQRKAGKDRNMNNKHMHNVILNKETCAVSVGIGHVGTHVCHCSILLTHVGVIQICSRAAEIPV